MPRQISDEEYNYLQQKRVTADFAESIFNDPALNNESKSIIKKKYPNLQIPDYDLEQKFNAKWDEEKKSREEKDKQEREKAERDKFLAQRTETQRQYGFTDEAMQRLEKMMLDRNIGDYEAAASYFASREPQSSEPTFDSTRWHHERQEGFADIAKDPESWGRNEIMRAIKRDEQRAKQLR